LTVENPMRSTLLRTGLALGVAGAVVLAGPSGAAGPCNLITDPTGDTTGPSTALDIVSGDLASDDKTLTGVIRTAALAETDASAPTGIAWSLRWTQPGSELPKYLLASKFQGSAVEFSYGEIDGTSLVELGVGTGVLDIAAKEVRISAPLKGLGLRKGVSLTELNALGQRVYGVSGAALYSPADSSDAATSKPYTTGAPSCVTPGK
jgi:hypothetical protein